MNVTQTILLDVAATGPVPRVWAKQGDDGTRFVVAKLVRMGAPYSLPEGVTAHLRAEKPDGNGILNPAQITEDGLILVELTDQVLACGGIVRADICLKDAEGNILSSMPFEIQVVSTPQGKNIMSTNEVLTLAQMVADGEQLNKDLSAALAEAAAQAKDANLSAEMAQSCQKTAENYAEQASLSSAGARQAEAGAVAASETADAAAQRAENAAGNVPTTINEALKQAKASGEFDGPPGPQGPVGETGPAGPQGEQGETGPEGPQGEKGLPGERGLAFYQLNAACAGSITRYSFSEFSFPDGYTPMVGDLVLFNDGMVGAIHEVLPDTQQADVTALWTSLKGPQGEAGEAGPQGEKGETGPAGSQGEKGEQGDQGIQGIQGEQGPQGEQGIPGLSIFYHVGDTSKKDLTLHQSTLRPKDRTAAVGDQVISGNGCLFHVASVGDDGWMNLTYLTTLAGSDASGAGIDVTARPGQLILVKEVDESGNPTAWEAIDRTHWEEITQAAVNYNADISFTNLMASISGIGTDAIIEGKTYTVTWNGETYECTAVLNGSVMLGNLSLMEMGEDTGEPFCMEMISANSAMIYKSTAATETIAVSISLPEIVTVHKLPGRFLPEGLPYSESGGMVGILPETEAVYDESDQMFMLTDSITGITAGEKYTVKYNGTEYEIVAGEYTEGDLTAIILGNYGALTGGEDTGEPFAMVIYSADMAAEAGFGAMIVPMDGATSCTISIYQDGEIIHKLDNKYLDLDWLPTVKKEFLIPEQTVDATENLAGGYTGGCYVAESLLFAIDVQTPVYVCIDGVEYEAVGIGSLDGDIIQGTDGFIDGRFRFAGAHTNWGFIADVSGTYTVSVYNKEINKMPESFLPESVGRVKTVNGVGPDEDGNVDVEIPEFDTSGMVKSVNGTAPDENGNVAITVPPMIEVGGLTEIVPPFDTKVQGDEFSGSADYSKFAPGKTYRVVYNGTAKDCVAVQNNAGTDDENIQLGDDDPFSLYIFKDGEISFWLSDATAVNLAIYSYENKAMKIDPEYLPEVTLTSPGGKKFKLTVDDNGTITATEVT